MSWHGLALIASVSYAFQNLVIKWLGNRKIPTSVILWFVMAASVPLLFVCFLLTGPHTYQPAFNFWLTVGVMGNLIAFYGYVRAIQISDVSLVAPIFSLSPLFMLLTSWLMLEEFPDFQGLVGIIVVVLGTYLLAKSPQRHGLEPFLFLWKDPGVRWALLVAIIWSVTANVDKLAVFSSHPVSYSFWFHVLLTVFLLFLLFKSKLSFLSVDFNDFNVNSDSNSIHETAEPKNTTVNLKSNWWIIVLMLLGVGILQATMSVAQMYGIVETNVTYIIAIKRAGMLISVLGGGLLFNESGLKRRFLAALLVFLGLIGIMFR